jgi:hypothetical protein
MSRFADHLRRSIRFDDLQDEFVYEPPEVETVSWIFIEK